MLAAIAPAAHAIPALQLYTRLAEAITKQLSAVTADGFGYRVDLNLRPHGRGGAIVLSLQQTLQYYESAGRTWERAALLKARVIAGDDALGDELLGALEPFVYRRSLDLGAVDALRERLLRLTDSPYLAYVQDRDDPRFAQIEENLSFYFLERFDAGAGARDVP